MAPARTKDFPLPPAPVTGVSKPTKGDRAPDHMAEFSRAIEAALRKARWPVGQDFTAEVQLRAVVSRYNPGAIDQYRATIVPTGPAGG